VREMSEEWRKGVVCGLVPLGMSKMLLLLLLLLGVTVEIIWATL